MKAILLAAGKGERLRPITSTRPKPLVPILCKPLIYWHLDALAKTGVDEVVVVVGYMGEKVVKAIEAHELSRKITVIKQEQELGTGDAVAKTLNAVDDSDEVLIVYGDLFLGDWSIYREVARLDGNFVVAVKHEDPRDYGVLLIDHGLVKGVVEKPDKPPTNLVNAGIYKFDVRVLKKYVGMLKPSPRGEIEFTDAITYAARDGVEIKVYSVDGSEWVDIGTPWNLLEANKIALKRFLRREVKGGVADNVSIEGPVFIGENAFVRPFTSIEGPVYIDEEVVVGPSARIRPYTTICRGSRIGFSVEVKESIIFEHVHISHLSYVGDSIICENVNFGAGTITANLRFDEREVKMTVKGRRVSTGRRKFGAVVGANVKTGINVSLMPGVKIGVNSWIAPGAIVDRDVPDNVFYRVRQEHYIDSLPNT